MAVIDLSIVVVATGITSPMDSQYALPFTGPESSSILGVSRFLTTRFSCATIAEKFPSTRGGSTATVQIQTGVDAAYDFRILFRMPAIFGSVAASVPTNSVKAFDFKTDIFGHGDGGNPAPADTQVRQGGVYSTASVTLQKSAQYVPHPAHMLLKTFEISQTMPVSQGTGIACALVEKAFYPDWLEKEPLGTFGFAQEEQSKLDNWCTVRIPHHQYIQSALPTAQMGYDKINVQIDLNDMTKVVISGRGVAGDNSTQAKVLRGDTGNEVTPSDTIEVWLVYRAVILTGDEKTYLANTNTNIRVLKMLHTRKSVTAQGESQEQHKLQSRTPAIAVISHVIDNTLNNLGANLAFDQGFQKREVCASQSLMIGPQTYAYWSPPIAAASTKSTDLAVYDFTDDAIMALRFGMSSSYLSLNRIDGVHSTFTPTAAVNARSLHHNVVVLSLAFVSQVSGALVAGSL